jgi:uncharacterized protein
MNAAFIPLSQVVLKVHSRCDLACDHCYVYEGVDQSWSSRPRAIPDQVISRTAERIAEHARAQGLDSVQVILHGGEPLLAGRTKLRRVASELQSALHGVCRLDLRVHTNGVLLDEKYCEFFAEYSIKVGISLDGDRAANDRHRRYADGRSSYDQVLRAIGLLRSDRFRDLYAGLLCTIDVANDPVAVYDSLASLSPPRVDFLLPHATWDKPPDRAPGAPSQYADWLLAIYDRWLADGRAMRIRIFESIFSTLNGGESQTEALGLSPVALVVIETDGSYEQVDSLKVAFDGAPATGLDVFRNTLTEAAGHPGLVARQQGLTGLCQTCQECPVVASCGGGLYTHRYRTGTEFANPSVYCADLMKLITYIGDHQPEDAARTDHAVVHTMSRNDFVALAAGFGGATGVAALTDAQRTVRRASLSIVYREGRGHRYVPHTMWIALRTAWATLTAIEHEQPEALDAVLSHPYVQAWVVRCLEWLGQLSPSNRSPWPPACAEAGVGNLAHLGAIAAAAAIRARSAATVMAPVIENAVYLPTLGRLTLVGHEGAAAAEDEPELATVDVADDTVVVKARASSWTVARAQLMPGELGADAPTGSRQDIAGGPGVDEPGGSGWCDDWQPMRVLRAPGLQITLDDIDPYRDCFRSKAAPRLTESEFARWEGLFRLAGQEIVNFHDAFAQALATGLTTLTPLVEAGDNPGAGATTRDAFGAVGAALPDDPVTLAFLLIQDFQRVKLGAILDLYDLFDRAGNPGQANEAKLLEGRLADAYARLAAIEFWRVRQKVTSGAAADAAGKLSANARAEARDAIQKLVKSTALTPLGQEFIHEMRRSADI